MGVPCKRRQNEANGRAEPPSCAIAVEKCRNPLAEKNNDEQERSGGKKYPARRLLHRACLRSRNVSNTIQSAVPGASPMNIIPEGSNKLLQLLSEFKFKLLWLLISTLYLIIYFIQNIDFNI
jgi:hypothetical protein